MTLMSRVFTRAMCSVRGIGVAERASTSMPCFHCFIFSFWATPKRCSSSIMSSPRSWNTTSDWSRRCVPMMMSTFPSASRCRTSSVSLPATKRLIIATRRPKGSRRSWKVSRCCWARTVVGTSTATCLPSMTALKAARSATSVLPYPTSPHSRRSMGTGFSMSALISAMAFSWSGVSS